MSDSNQTSQTSQNEPVYVAPHPEMVRQNQKDEEIISSIRSKLLESLELLTPWAFHPRLLSLNQDLVDLASILLYFCLTNLLGNKSLGEEYSYTKQVNIKEKFSLSLWRRVLHIFLRAVPMFVIQKWLKGYFSRMKQGYSGTSGQKWNSRASTRIAAAIVRHLPEAPGLLGNIFRFHMMLFFLQGKYFQISKRLSGIRYVLDNKKPDHSIDYSRIGYVLLAHNSIQTAQFLYRVVMEIRRLSKEHSESKKGTFEANQGLESSQTGDKGGNNENDCLICCDVRRNAAATPCGHLFCWECILKSTRIKAECPACKGPAAPRDIVRLRNII